jgi:hypothetical protein
MLANYELMKICAERLPEYNVQKIMWRMARQTPVEWMSVKVYGILQRKINTGSQGDDVVRDSGRNGSGNEITIWSCRLKFVGSVDQFFE